MISTPSPNKIQMKRPENGGNEGLGNGSSISSNGGTSGTGRSKGIGLNLAISPVSTDTPKSRSSSYLSTVNETPEPLSESKFDIQLPSMEELVKLDMEEQLRLLALKEMAMVELKDTINNLTNKLNQHEQEVHKLRQLIQKSLYTEMNQTRDRTNSNPRDEANSRRKSGDKSLWSNLSKPLNLIQQFDTMLQNEFEKSLIHNPQQRHSGISQDSNSSSGSPLKGKSQDTINLNEVLDEDVYKETYAKEYQKYRDSYNKKNPQDDVLQSVSSSIWSFVNDVRTNVLNSINDESVESVDEFGFDQGLEGKRNASQLSSDGENTIINEEEFNKILNLDRA